MALAAQADVEARLGRSLTTEEEGRLPGLLDEASALVEAWFHEGGCTIADPTPSNVTLVVSRMAARVLQVTDQQQPGVDSSSVTAGPFSMSRSYSASSSQGGPWINKTDRSLLRTLCAGSSAAFNVPMS
ncbi:hypothetical protein [Nocardia vulneris]|uniref:hypothetical protein n=1 Tax=Nocardia vulneris TaxID=1141657 RepID=UPI0009E5D3DC|nr:hypothetical protein [Nocardia vulneris]